MIKVAITGNIGSGKSAVEKFLMEMNYPVVDADKIVHNLMNERDDIISYLGYLFRDYDIFSDGLISRRKLAKVVFKEKKLLDKLTETIYPYVIDEILKFFEANANSIFAFVSVPMLYEANWTYLFDKVIMVAANDEIRLNRLVETRNYSRDYAQMRMDAQIPQEEKMHFADYVIYNNVGFDYLQQQINDILSKMI